MLIERVGDAGRAGANVDGEAGNLAAGVAAAGVAAAGEGEGLLTWGVVAWVGVGVGVLCVEPGPAAAVLIAAGWWRVDCEGVPAGGRGW